MLPLSMVLAWAVLSIITAGSCTGFQQLEIGG